MRKPGILTICFMCLLAGLVACSSSEADSTKVDKQWNDPVLDSLAQIRHDIRNKDNKLVTLETNYGKMTLELFHDVAPAHADSFVARAVDGFYDSTIFHRVVQNFMIQGGDPTGTGTGDAGYNLPAEFSDLQHVDGTLSMARGRSENSASCQFFICLGRNRSTEYLDGKYTVFGQLIKGYDVLHAIGDVKVGPQPHGEKSKPLAKVALFKAYVSDRDGNAL